MKEFLDYDIKYPDLVLSIVNYFSLNNGEKPDLKSVQKFIETYDVPLGEEKIQPDIVGRICDRLCEYRMMSCIRKNGLICLNDNYCCRFQKQQYSEKSLDFLYLRLNSIAYGFEYIYRYYLPFVHPVVIYSERGEAMGTCFRMFNGLVTAKHCLTDGYEMAIKGYSAELLNNSRIFVSRNENIDIAYIDTQEELRYNLAVPHVLDDILVMGYPKVSSFINFCTVEKANISAMADLRMTPTFGSIAAEEKPFFPRGLPKLLLITAKIRDGNSGGPLINKEGLVTGVSTDLPAGEGNSDDNVGYGMAYPIQSVEEMISEGNTQKFNFVDFPD